MKNKLGLKNLKLTSLKRSYSQPSNPINLLEGCIRGYQNDLFFPKPEIYLP